ncbi:4606_t:CDS:2 [Ambispora leptoticha]|uniref:4606_t:CDS:1 n=1 Tax=Ambispora leptoticha TaxID=144679 RepID=A0A9N8YRC0_9GLOM|nr:4606_t:CDS:2 [Ambispora leptoticha]
MASIEVIACLIYGSTSPIIRQQNVRIVLSRTIYASDEWFHPATN